jgi:YjbE family integral membrane protein
LDLFSTSALFILVQVLMINLVLSGDNAVVIGMVAAHVESEERRKVIVWGMGAAVALRILLALMAVDLLKVLGLTLAGGIILLWVAWRLYRDIHQKQAEQAAVETMTASWKPGAKGARTGSSVPFGRAILQIAIADISMSIDNVLAIAGAANRNIPILVIGLVLSVGFMGIAATYIAKLLQRYPALSYVGVVLIVYVAAQMIWTGSADVREILRIL